MRAGRHAKRFVASVRYADGATYQYLFDSTARRRRDAEVDARTSAEHAGGTLVDLTLIGEAGPGARARRLLVVAGSIVVVVGATIAAAIMGLTS